MSSSQPEGCQSQVFDLVHLSEFEVQWLMSLLLFDLLQPPLLMQQLLLQLFDWWQEEEWQCWLATGQVKLRKKCHNNHICNPNTIS